MKITILGSGTSSGIPVIACSCTVCTSANQKNKRLRSSILIELSEEETGAKHPYFILVDAGPDFRMQALTHKIPRIDMMLCTHSHADHIYGIDDIRMYNFKQKTSIPVYADQDTSKALKRIFTYCFDPDPGYEGGGVPKLILNTVEPQTAPINDPSRKIHAEGFIIQPLRVFHGKYPILGFKLGDFAYLTDCSYIPEETITALKGVKYLILDGLRYRPHKTHFTIPQAMSFALEQGFQKTFLTHISHEIEHDLVNNTIETLSTGRVSLAYDGLILEVPSVPVSS